MVFLNDISQDYKNAILSKSDIFVMPSIKYKKSVEDLLFHLLRLLNLVYHQLEVKMVELLMQLHMKKPVTYVMEIALDEIYSSIQRALENNLYKHLGAKAKIAARIRME